MANDKNLNKNLKKLEEISSWFDNIGEVDVEEGLEKVKEAIVLIKESKERLKKVENEFEELKKDLTLNDTD